MREPAGVLVAQRLGREPGLDHRHQGAPVSRLERELQCWSRSSTRRAGSRSWPQDPARALDRLEHVPVAVELAGRRAEGDRPDAADAQVAARVDDPARRVLCRRTRAGRPGSVKASNTRSGGPGSGARSAGRGSRAASAPRSARSGRAGPPRRGGSPRSTSLASPRLAEPSRHSRARPTFSVSTRSARSRIPTCFLIPLSVSPYGCASSLIVAGPPPRRSRIPRRVGSERAKNVPSSVDDSAPIGALY